MMSSHTCIALVFLSLSSIVYCYQGLFGINKLNELEFWSAELPDWINPDYDDELFAHSQMKSNMEKGAYANVEPNECKRCWEYCCKNGHGDTFCDYCNYDYYFDCKPPKPPPLSCYCNVDVPPCPPCPKFPTIPTCPAIPSCPNLTCNINSSSVGTVQDIACDGCKNDALTGGGCPSGSGPTDRTIFYNVENGTNPKPLYLPQSTDAYAEKLNIYIKFTFEEGTLPQREIDIEMNVFDNSTSTVYYNNILTFIPAGGSSNSYVISVCQPLGAIIIFEGTYILIDITSDFEGEILYTGCASITTCLNHASSSRHE